MGTLNNEERKAPIFEIPMISIIINRRKLSIVLIAIFIVLFVAHGVVTLLRYRLIPESPFAESLDRFFSMDREANFPTYFNTLLLFIAAQTFFLMGSKRSYIDFYSRTYWYFLSVIFVFLSVDEFVSFHEQLIDLIPQIFGIGGTGLFRFAWIIPYGLFVIGFGSYSIQFLLTLKKEYMVKYLFAGAVYVFGALVMEALGGTVFAQNNNVPTLEYILYYVTPEETLEMLPLIYVIDLNLKYLSSSEADQ